ncbi:hypothetical protein GGTG_02888 [Gaeumannomyces tritici R3-111a-1]|uniref:Secreted peptide n=1 Tax=Gaeumannomyces tritici (strain R3-111a-1) TaxID=644352 RepID=J3NNN1_GAET3|nr:hypothetical protein GGTG_02888 [Gaeumannomyces tritici R3-111a-1]EJT77783.1 hypothetical protein GGTG_02888 [Gaeumannomyces tritici R3-111a-1]
MMDLLAWLLLLPPLLLLLHHRPSSHSPDAWPSLISGIAVVLFVRPASLSALPLASLPPCLPYPMLLHIGIGKGEGGKQADKWTGRQGEDRADSKEAALVSASRQRG